MLSELSWIPAQPSRFLSHFQIRSPDSAIPPLYLRLLESRVPNRWLNRLADSSVGRIEGRIAPPILGRIRLAIGIVLALSVSAVDNRVWNRLSSRIWGSVYVDPIAYATPLL